MPSLSSFLKLLIVVFPIAMGLGLTGLGVFRLMQAGERPVSRPLAPYGILAFSSEKCEFSMNIWLYSFDLKGNLVYGFFTSHFMLSSSVKGNSSYEVIFGLQIPYHVEILQDSEHREQVDVGAINPNTKEWKTVVEVLDKKTVFSQVNQTSIFYVRFMTMPGFTVYYVNVTFDWKDLVNRQSFSLYEIVVPFCSSPHNIAVQYFPQVHPLNHTGINLSMELPEDGEIRDTIPLPDKEEMSSQTDPSRPGVLEPQRYLSWKLPPNRLLGEEEGWPTSDIVRVRLELLGESELRGRLQFDSGLYLGLGVGLIISGIHEAIKYATEAGKKTT